MTFAEKAHAIQVYSNHSFFILMGDLRQVLPVVHRGNRSQIVNTTVVQSRLCNKGAQIHVLDENMRVKNASKTLGGEKNSRSYQGLLRLPSQSRGRPSTSLHFQQRRRNRMYSRPAEMLLPQPAKLDDLINYVFGDMPHVPAKLNSAQVAICATYFSDKAILTPKNYRAHEVNKAVLKRLRGQEYVCRSVDNTADGDNTNAKFPVEFLNSLNLSGLLDHELHLKVGCVVMVLRNISPSIGLCNGTRTANHYQTTMSPWTHHHGRAQRDTSQHLFQHSENYIYSLSLKTSMHRTHIRCRMMYVFFH